MGLLRWVKSWFASDQERYDIYKPQERLIFSYWNGAKQIEADPMVLYKRVSAKGGDIETVQKIATSTLIKQEIAIKAHDDLVRYIREIFALPKPAGDGIDCTGCLTEPQCIDLLDAFYIFTGAQKKSTSQTQISAKETSAPTPNLSGDGQPTTNTLDSGSTANEPVSESPPSSNSVSSSPSVSPIPDSATTGQ